MTDAASEAVNVVRNHAFEEGEGHWVPFGGCRVQIVAAVPGPYIQPRNGQHYAAAVGRTQSWEGLAQKLAVKPKVPHHFSAWVRILGSAAAPVQATLKLGDGGAAQYRQVAGVVANDRTWTKMVGNFELTDKDPPEPLLYFQGPPPEVDIVIDSASAVCSASRSLPAKMQGLSMEEEPGEMNVLQNAEFKEGLRCWAPSGGCKVAVGARSPALFTPSGAPFAVVSQRSATWEGLSQDVTRAIRAGPSYTLSALVRLGQPSPSPVVATLKLGYPERPEEYIRVGSVQASDKQWAQLAGSFSLPRQPAYVLLYFEGPPPGVDMLVASAKLLAPQPAENTTSNVLSKKLPQASERLCQIERVPGVNLVSNPDFSQGAKHWQGFCCEVRVVKSGESLPPHGGSHYLHCCHRKELWQGPAQCFPSGVLHAGVQYETEAWIRVQGADQACLKLTAKVTYCNGKEDWVPCGQCRASSASWRQLLGCLTLEHEPKEVLLYLQKPDPGVDILLSYLSLVPVTADPEHYKQDLNRRTDQVRRRDARLRVVDQTGAPLAGCQVAVSQTRRGFPLGCVINSQVISNPRFVDYFLQRFTWTVFENEAKWYHTEAKRGSLNYKDADQLLAFCEKHNLSVRGHCLYWAVLETGMPEWVHCLRGDQLWEAVEKRMQIVERYKGRFKHWDVNNEMLHGAFFKDRLGEQVRAWMFQRANEIDPTCLLFVNDFHIMECYDDVGGPDNYVDQIAELLERGAPIHGIGLQAHVYRPAPLQIRQALDKVAQFGLPIWLTEMDVNQEDKGKRAHYLEVLMREAYAHPAVAGILLWGCWEGSMWTKNGALVDKDWQLNEAGSRFDALLDEWTTKGVAGVTDSGGCLSFRGFLGEYLVRVAKADGTVSELPFELQTGAGAQEVVLKVDAPLSASS